MRTTVEEIKKMRMKQFKIYHINNIEISYYPTTPLYNKFYKVFKPGLGIEQFSTKEKAIDYIINELQV